VWIRKIKRGLEQKKKKASCEVFLRGRTLRSVHQAKCKRPKTLIAFLTNKAAPDNKGGEGCGIKNEELKPSIVAGVLSSVWSRRRRASDPGRQSPL